MLVVVIFPVCLTLPIDATQCHQVTSFKVLWYRYTRTFRPTCLIIVRLGLGSTIDLIIIIITKSVGGTHTILLVIAMKTTVCYP